MASIKPAARGRALFAATLLVVSALAACARRPPRLVPPPGGVEAVEGFGSASIAGADAAVKGRFGFVFRRPGLARIEAVDPVGRTAFLIVVRGERAWFAVPGRKVYAEDAAAVMMERVLGVALLPDEAVRLLSGTWRDGESGWSVEPGAGGRVGRGSRGEHSFTVLRYFPGDGVPREIALEGPGSSGRVKVLKLSFDPPPRDEAFAVDFVRAFALKTWEEILELLDR